MRAGAVQYDDLDCKLFIATLLAATAQATLHPIADEMRRQEAGAQ